MLFGAKDTVKKPVYIAVARTEQYFVDGVDVLDVSARKFLQNVRVKIGAEPRLAPLFRVAGKTCRFKVVVTPLFEKVFAVCFLTKQDFRRGRRRAEDSLERNKELLYQWSLQRAALKKQKGYIYSHDCSRRALIVVDGNVTKVEIESLCLFPQINASLPQGPEDVDKFVWIFEHENTSIYGSKDAAMQDLVNFFGNFK